MTIVSPDEQLPPTARPRRAFPPGAAGAIAGFAIGIVLLVAGPAVVHIDTNYLIPTWWKLTFAVVGVSSYFALLLIGRGWIQWSLAIATFVLCAYLIRVQLDVAHDPTDHNLLPFELFFDFIGLIIPAAIGGGAGQVVHRRSRAHGDEEGWRPNWRRKAP